MALSNLQFLEIIEGLENYIDQIRPPVEVRNKLDISYRIEGQSVIICDIRPAWNTSKIIESDAAKATYIKAKNHWKVFWKRADLKWHAFDPQLVVETVKDFVELVNKDSYGCFWG